MIGKIRHRQGKLICELDEDHFVDLATVARLCEFRTREFASKLKISERQLERVFHQEAGVAPKAWLRDQRMIYVKELFERGLHKRLVASIAGFKSYSHFASEVTQHFGTQPKHLEKLPSEEVETES
ncbi:MAG: helix-turn-helix domain-containing protein [Limisphaerales bacterium]|jgi:transcriptional regulator GlxA family with amidase domain